MVAYGPGPYFADLRSRFHKMGIGPGPSVYHFLGVSLDDRPLTMGGQGWGTKMVGRNEAWFGGVGKRQDQGSWIQKSSC